MHSFSAQNCFRMSCLFPHYACDSHVLGYVRVDDVLSCGRRGALLLCLLGAYIWLVGSQSILWRCHCGWFLRWVKVLSEYFMATLIVAGFSSCCSCEFRLVEQTWFEIRLFRQSVGNRPQWNRTMSNMLCEKNLQQHRTIHGWWFGSFFPYIGNNHPNWLIFFRGLKLPTSNCQFKCKLWVKLGCDGHFNSWIFCYHLFIPQAANHFFQMVSEIGNEIANRQHTYFSCGVSKPHI